tara:strand:- start:199 stop:456 length:258 start_codon:yes stop_codon:yes gene_type:complete
LDKVEVLQVGASLLLFHQFPGFPLVLVAVSSLPLRFPVPSPDALVVVMAVPLALAVGVVMDFAGRGYYPPSVQPKQKRKRRTYSL